MHGKVMDLFKKYLLIGGLPDAVNSFIADTNIVKVRTIHRDIRAFYADDASKYEADNNKKLKIRRIYDMIPSNLESKKKRVGLFRISRTSEASVFPTIRMSLNI